MRSYRARHAKPALHSRSLGGGLTAALLPLTMATPAFTGTASAAPSSVVSSTAMRISVPTGTVAPGAQRVGVRLLGDGRFVPGATVVVQKRSSAGWVPAATLRTSGVGHAVVHLPLSRNTVVRAVFPGTATQPASATREAAVIVRKPVARRVVTARAALRAKSSGGGLAARALQVAAAQAGKPYRYGSAGPSSFDCSGLVNFAFRAVGKALPRTSGALRASTQPVSRAAARPGDLIFTPGHVGIYAGGGKMVDAPRAGKPVSLRRIYTANYTVGRVV